MADASQRRAAIATFADGLADNDAEALEAGWQGRQGWAQAKAEAEAAAGRARDPDEFGLVLGTLYARYPSLRSHSELRADIDYRSRFDPPSLPFTLKVDLIEPGVYPTKVFVWSMDENASGTSGRRSEVGDQVVTINGRPIAHWKRLSRPSTSLPRARLRVTAEWYPTGRNLSGLSSAAVGTTRPVAGQIAFSRIS